MRAGRHGQAEGGGEAMTAGTSRAFRRASGPRHDCGVVGVFGVERAAERAYAALYALQHRGQESAGIVVSDGERIQSKKGLGLLTEAVRPPDLRELPGHMAVGHVRYSTTGARRVQNIQPLVIEYSRGIVAVAHNGNLTNARSLRALYESRGSIFQTSTDSEIFVHLLADPEHIGAADPLGESLRHVEGAYSLVLMTARRLMAARDPLGFRPLSLAGFEGGYVLASETCAFDLLVRASRVLRLRAHLLRQAGQRAVRQVRPPGAGEARRASCA